MYTNIVEQTSEISVKFQEAKELEGQLEGKIELLQLLLEERNKYLVDFNYHLSEGSNAYAMGDKRMWLFHKNLREPLGKIVYPVKSAIEKAKNENAKIVQSLNVLYDAIDKHEGRHYEYQGDTLGNATQTISFPPNTPEWHEQRLKGIGGSDIAAIMGLSPWTSREELFLLKTGQVVADNLKTTSGALWRGNIWEDYIARKYALKDNAELLVHCKASWVNNERTHQFANLDGLLYSDGASEPGKILEIKTSSTPDSWSEGVPAYYRTQVLWYMDSFGIKAGVVTVMIDDSQMKEFDVIPKTGEIEKIHTDVNEFMAEVEDFKINGDSLKEGEREAMESLRPQMA